MENKPKFNKELFTTIALQNFLTDYAHSGKVENAYNKLLNLNKNNEEKRKILENCKALFENTSTKKEVDLEIATIRSEFNTTKDRKPTDSEIAKWLIKCFSEEIFVANKRSYDMSQIASKGMLSTVKTPQGKTLKVVAYVSWEQQQKKRNQENYQKSPPEKLFIDRRGNTIHIQFMGCLAYRTPSSNQYIYKHRITKTIAGIEQEPVEKFSNIDIFAMNYDKEYCDLVVSELLSEKNLNRSNADDYIGEISEESALKTGEEKFESGFYTYQMSSKYALVYNGERIEAIRAFNQQQAIKNAEQPIKSDTHKKADDELEI